MAGAMPGPQGGGGWLGHLCLRKEAAGGLDSWVWGQKGPGVQILGSGGKGQDEGPGFWVLVREEGAGV